VTGANARIVGRDAEQGELDAFLDADRLGSLVLCGGAGIGKTTLWEVGIEAAHDRGLRVLSARASDAETQLPFAALIDLCDGIDEELSGLPVPQRSALEVALLRTEPSGAPVNVHAIALGFLKALRLLTSRAPVLVAIDDIQWLDGPSADVLTFVARRVQGERLGFLVARRVDRSSPFEDALERRGVERLEVGPLSFGAARRLLSLRLGLNISRQLLRRVLEITMGNPLFLLELGRALLAGGLPEIGGEIPMPGGIEEVFGARLGSLAGPVRRLLLAVALSADIRVSELAAIGEPEVFDDAVDSGLLLVDGDRVRASHPLLAAVVKTSSRRQERRELHLALAEAVADPGLRAMHLALATELADARLAATVGDAAAGAAARGARQQAVQLAEHALRLTPPASPARSERVLRLAEYLETAGEVERLTALLTPEVALLPTGPARARAWLMLAEGSGPQNLNDIQHHRERALAECGNDPLLRSRVLAKKAASSAASVVTQIDQAATWAAEALEAAKHAGPDAMRLVLYAVAWTRAMAGQPVDDLCELSGAAFDASAYLAACPERVAAQRLVWRGEISRARAMLNRLLLLADERGERESYALLRLHLCELHLRVGEWDPAALLLDEWAESSDLELMFRPKYERCRALLAAGRGDAAGAEEWARRTIARANQTGCQWDGLEGLRALGIAHLLAHRPADAAESLRAVWQHAEMEGVEEPGVFPVAPELVTALAALGKLTAAREVTRRLRELGERHAHPWAGATAMRCEGVIRLAGGAYDDEAAEILEGAIGAYERLGLSFDAGRSALSLGSAQRRSKKWGAARRNLERAAATFHAIGSDGWVEQARSELARVGARRPRPSGELTATERRTAELASNGLSNKEISRELVVTVHTVEIHLSRAYAKLGIRSRGQLAQHILASPEPKD
jgi:DNA-binding CsgD family transcriptional regulator